MKFTILVRNHALKSGKYEGTFDKVEDAVAHAIALANRSRSFCEFEVWRGTPREPIALLKGHDIYKGRC